MNFCEMPKRKTRTKTTNGTGQTGEVQNAKRTSKVSQPGLEPKRVFCNQARLTLIGSNTSDQRNNFKRGRHSEKENVSSVTDVSKVVGFGIQVRTDIPPARRALRSCTLKNTEQLVPIAIVERDSDKPIKDSMGMSIEIENIRHQKNLQVSSVSPSSIIASDENTTLINSPKTYSTKGKLVENIPFSSTPMIRPVSESKKNGPTLSVHQKRRQMSSSSSIPSETTYSEAITCSSQFKAPTSKCAQLKDAPFSSTPMKDTPIPNGDLTTDRRAGQILPKFVLSPIRSTCSKTSPIMLTKFMNNSVANVEALECISEDKEGNSRFTDIVQKYTKMPDMEFVASRSDNGDSGSGEYDPFKLFILHDPITTNDMPDPRTSNFRNCELKVKEFDDLGLPLQQKKPTKKTKKAKNPVAKCEKVKSENIVGPWLQKIEEMNREFSEIESMDLCIE